MNLKARVTRRRIAAVIFFSLSAAWLCSGQTAGIAKSQEAPLAPGFIRIEELPTNGFLYPFYLYVPPELREKRAMYTLLVLPNNTGKVDDDFSVHDRSARELAEERPLSACICRASHSRPFRQICTENGNQV